MSRRFSSPIVAAYLLLCILLGGSAQGVWTNLILQVAGLGLIAWAGLARRSAGDQDANPLVLQLICACAALVILLQLIPLPARIWTELPGREQLAAALRLDGRPTPSMTVSEAPYDTLLTLLSVLPAIAAYVATRLLHPSPRWLAGAVVIGMVISIALGALQVAGGAQSWAYFYEITNTGAVGVFANRNHMATLLLAAAPFATALLASSRVSRAGSAQGRIALGSAMLVLVLVGIVLNGSLAALALIIPVLIASAALVPAAVRWRRLALPIAAIASIGGLAILAVSPISTAGGEATSVESRQRIWATSFEAVSHSFPVGTGLGTFEQVYRQFEDPAAVGVQYVNHAHNDYLELVLELGAAGLFLLLAFIAWWSVTAVKIWTSPLTTAFGRAATIVSAAILAHSIVDFPLRTASIAAIFAVALALMLRRPRTAQGEGEGGSRRARHVRLG
ncbi:MAG TPA: O-antigen ligase family protein [Sphingomicrobium sp.]|nr:O-antigen ligase family protein [Sphingomicrobium sp.]